MEVMIAVMIFFTCTFAILDLMAQSIRSARSLSIDTPSVALRAAGLSMSNTLEEGFTTGDFRPLYPTYSWSQEIIEAGTNGWWQVNLTLYNGGAPDSKMTTYMFKPEANNRGRAGRTFRGSTEGPAPLQ